MAPFIMIVLSIGLMALLGIASLGWGIDSRPSYGDDHAR
jgi:hypothetical protein